MTYISAAAVLPNSHILSPLSEMYNRKTQWHRTFPPHSALTSNQDTSGDREFVCSPGTSRIKDDTMCVGILRDMKGLPELGKLWIRE